MNYRTVLSVTLALAALSVISGCKSDGKMKATTGPQKMDDGAAAFIEVTPASALNPIATQHVFVATVKDCNGKPLANRRVEWIIPQGSVGAIVEVDGRGTRERGHKIDNGYAISHTASSNETVKVGPGQQINIGPGQTWVAVTSSVRGATEVIAYAPGIADWTRHKAYARKLWADVSTIIPKDATNCVGTPHQLVTRIARHSDGGALAEYSVTYTILSGPEAKFQENNSRTITVRSGADGTAKATLVQAAPREGVNEVKIEVVGAAMERGQNVPVLTTVMKKTWQAGKLSLTKKAPASMLACCNYDYQITVSNPSAMPVNDVVVTDELPKGLQYISSNPSAQLSGQKLSWSIGQLAANQSKTMTVQVRPVEQGRVGGLAEARGSCAAYACARAETMIQAPQLTLTTQGPDQALICDQLCYVITVKNTGDVPATNIQLQTQYPAGMRAYGGKEADAWNIGTLQPGESRQIKTTATVAKPGEYVNTVNLTADCDLKGSAGWKTMVRQPVLVITKNAPATRFVGGNVVYNITVTNRGDAPADQTVVTDTLSSNVRFVNATEGGTFSNGKVSWNLGTLKVGETRNLCVTVQATQAGTLQNAAEARSTCGQASVCATTEIRGIPSGIHLEVTDICDPVEVTGGTTYRIRVVNQGDAADRNVVVTATLPAEMQIVSIKGTTKENVQGNTITFEGIGELGAKQTAEYNITVRSTKVGDAHFEARVTSSMLTKPVVATESTHIYGNQ